MPKSKLSIIPKEPAQCPHAPNNLPVELGRLVGRDWEVETVCRLLSGAADQEAHLRLLTLVGPGGVGKTRLALQVAEEILDEFDDGVYFVELASLIEADLVIPTIAAALQVREASGAPFLSTLKTHLLDKSMLLALDNFEQVLSAGPDLAELLAACPDLKLLVTSRAAVGLRNEQVFAVSPLSMPPLRRQLNIAQLLQYGAIELFAQRASTLHGRF